MMLEMNSIILISVVFLAYAECSIYRKPCIPKKFKNSDTIVCVCNATYCDNIDPLPRLIKGMVTVYETSKYGNQRLQESLLEIGTIRRSVEATKQQIIKVDKSIKKQKIIGFGGSFTDATGYVISLLPKELQDNIISDYFSKDGLEFTLNRLPIGGADFSLRPYTYNDGHDGDFNLTKFALQPEDEKYKIPYMKQAQNVSQNQQRFFGSPWSAPAWMKTNNEIHHGGFLKGTPGGQYYKTWANYYVKFLDAYKAHGLDMWGLTVINEPSAGSNPTYKFNSMGFTKETERDFIRKDLGPILQAAGYGPDKLNLMIFDDQRDGIFDWANTIYKDREAAKYVAGTAFHWYNNLPENLGNLDKTHKLKPDKFILNTEACNGFGIGNKPKIGDWGNMERVVADIINDLNHYVAGWVTWNMVLDTSGGPNWATFGADAPIIADPDKKEYYKQPEYFGLSHFSKTIPPGSTILGFNQTLNDPNILTTVALRPDNGVAVVILNTEDTPVDVTVIEDSHIVTLSISGKSVHTLIFPN